MRYSIVIPCYNEEENVHRLVKAFVHLGEKYNSYDVEYIFVENGSEDGTRKELEKAVNGRKNFKILYIDKNKGYGYGLLQGFCAATGDYVGWLHADLQVHPIAVFKMMHYLEQRTDGKKYFIKARRPERSLTEHIFTSGMTVFETLLFQTYMYDIGAVPVLFHQDLLKTFDKPPYDFSMDIYCYYQAKRNHYLERRCVVSYKNREKGQSAWNKGFFSRFRQGLRVMRASILLRMGKQVM